MQPVLFLQGEKGKKKKEVKTFGFLDVKKSKGRKKKEKKNRLPKLLS